MPWKRSEPQPDVNLAEIDTLKRRDLKPRRKLIARVHSTPPEVVHHEEGEQENLAVCNQAIEED
jgi:hypothetical protein